MHKLIIVDDDEVYHGIAQLMLKKYNLICELISSMDAKATLEYLIEHSSNAESLPDYIFVDLYMPEFNGWNFLNAYENIHRSFLKVIQVYIVSASVDPQDLIRSHNYPFVNSFINKPLKREFLNALIDS